jgi:beta-lactamase class A
LVRRAIVESDSAAVDILTRQLGGPQGVQAFLDRKVIQGVRIDRDERHLQTEILGLTWNPEYIDAAKLDQAIQAVPVDRRAAAYRRYQTDPRDSATPRGMASLLQDFAIGKILTPASTQYLLDLMTQTETGPDRLKAGVPSGWTLGHKTGTSGSWQGITAATNDVGVLTAPDGGILSVVVFIGDSHATDQARAALMAQIAAATIAQYH